MKARQITKKEFRIAAAYHEAGMPSQPAVSGSGFASQPLSPMAIWGGRSRSDGKSQVPGLLLVEANGGILPGVGRKGW